MKVGFVIAALVLLPLPMGSAATSFRAASPFGDDFPMVSVGRPSSPVQVARGVPTDARIHEFLVTTDRDILGIDSVDLALGGGTELYQLPPTSGGQDSEPPWPSLELLFQKSEPTLG
jgi:hypothetical protein